MNFKEEWNENFKHNNHNIIRNNSVGSTVYDHSPV